MVYIRPVLVSDLSADLQREAEGIETLYSVHRPDGARVALVADRRMAFALAREPTPAHKRNLRLSRLRATQLAKPMRTRAEKKRDKVVM
jgi:hypothetical protein